MVGHGDGWHGGQGGNQEGLEAVGDGVERVEDVEDGGAGGKGEVGTERVNTPDREEHGDGTAQGEQGGRLDVQGGISHGWLASAGRSRPGSIFWVGVRTDLARQNVEQDDGAQAVADE